MIKKHKILSVAIVLYIVVGLIEPEKLLPAFKETQYYFFEMLQILPAVFILTSLIQTWIPTNIIMKYFGDGSGIKGYLISFGIGSLSAGPIYAAFPVCQTLLKKGAGVKNIVIILSTWAVIKVPMLINEAKFMGMDYMIKRWFLTIVSILIMTWLMGIVLDRKDIIIAEENPKIDQGLCILCGKCLASFPDAVEDIDGHYVLIDGIQSEGLKVICPVGAIK